MIETASRHGLATRCIWLDTPLAQAQVNLVERLLERLGSLPGPEELRELARGAGRARADLPDARAPRARAAVGRRGLRRRRAAAVRAHAVSRDGVPGVFVAAAALRQPGWEQRARGGRSGRASPRLRLEPGRRRPRRSRPIAARLAAEVSGPVESALCPHPAGPPTCWCRPPLPGLPLAFARAHGVDPSRSTLDRHRARAPDARDGARRALRRGLSRYRERGSRSSTSSPSSPVLRTIQCVSCLTTSISISGV